MAFANCYGLIVNKGVGLGRGVAVGVGVGATVGIGVGVGVGKPMGEPLSLKLRGASVTLPGEPPKPKDTWPRAGITLFQPADLMT